MSLKTNTAEGNETQQADHRARAEALWCLGPHCACTALHCLLAGTVAKRAEAVGELRGWELAWRGEGGDGRSARRGIG